MDYFQLTVVEKIRKFMFTASGQNNKKIRKETIKTAAATTMTPKMVVIITNRSFETRFDFASHKLSIKWQVKNRESQNRDGSLLTLH